MDTIIPLISSGTEGPLGVKHLPRLWLKTLLSAYGLLPEGYKDIRPGFDYMVLEGLGIDPDSARTYIVEERPTYLEFEAWIKARPGADTSPGNIAKVNEEVASRQKEEASRKKALAKYGLEDDGSITDSIMLNNLDDWQSIHKQVAAVGEHAH